MNNCVDPRMMIRVQLFSLRKELYLLKLKKIFGKSDLERIKEIEKEIKKLKEFSINPTIHF